MDAKEVLVLITGANKAFALYKVFSKHWTFIEPSSWVSVWSWDFDCHYICSLGRQSRRVCATCGPCLHSSSTQTPWLSLTRWEFLLVLLFVFWAIILFQTYVFLYQGCHPWAESEDSEVLQGHVAGFWTFYRQWGVQWQFQNLEFCCWLPCRCTRTWTSSVTMRWGSSVLDQKLMHNNFRRGFCGRFVTMI